MQLKQSKCWIPMMIPVRTTIKSETGITVSCITVSPSIFRFYALVKTKSHRSESQCCGASSAYKQKKQRWVVTAVLYTRERKYREVSFV